MTDKDADVATGGEEGLGLDAAVEQAFAEVYGKNDDKSAAEGGDADSKADKASDTTADDKSAATVPATEAEKPAAKEGDSKQELKPEVGALAAFEPILKSAEPALKLYGDTAQEGLKQLLNIENYARQDPTGYIRWFAAQFNVDLGKLGVPTAQPPAKADEGAQGGEEEEYLSPEAKEIKELKNRLAQFEGQQKATSEQQVRANAHSEIDAFAKDPANKHFEAVQGTMAQLIASKQAATLKEAYEKAIWLVPEAREAFLKERSDAAAAESKKAQQQTAAARLAKAQKAAGTHLNTDTTTNGKSRSKGLDADIDEAWEQVYGN